MAKPMTRREVLARIADLAELAVELGATQEDVKAAVAEAVDDVPCPCGNICRLCDYSGHISPSTFRRYRERYPDNEGSAG